ncbi:MAG: tyrosine-type recombinase/integrase, partial [Asticcacaulis sp.]
MSLSDTTIRNAKPQSKQYKLHDEGGLFLIIRPSGGKLWRLKYRVGGKEQQLTIGTYPAVGLKEARIKRDEAKKLLASGSDPSVEKKRKAAVAAVKAANTFKAVAEEFIDKRERDGLAEATVTKARWFTSLLEPGIGNRPVSDIEPAEVLAVL